MKSLHEQNGGEKKKKKGFSSGLARTNCTRLITNGSMGMPASIARPLLIVQELPVTQILTWIILMCWHECKEANIFLAKLTCMWYRWIQSPMVSETGCDPNYHSILDDGAWVSISVKAAYRVCSWEILHCFCKSLFPFVFYLLSIGHACESQAFWRGGCLAAMVFVGYI